MRRCLLNALMILTLCGIPTTAAYGDTEAALLSAPLAALGLPGDQVYPKVAFDGVNYLVVWSKVNNQIFNGIFGTRVGADGAILDETPIPIAPTPYGAYPFGVLFDGTNYVVLWWENHSLASKIGLRATRVSRNGAVVDASPLISLSSEDPWMLGFGGAALGFDGHNYLLAWMSRDDPVANTGHRILAARFSTNGDILDATPIAVSAPGNYLQGNIALGYDGINYLLVWDSNRTPTRGTDIFGARISPGGEVLDPQAFTVSSAVGHQMVPALAFDGTNYLAIWMDSRADGPAAPRLSQVGIYGARIGRDGVVLEETGIAISPPGVLCWGGPYTVAFNGTDYLVFWSNRINYRAVDNRFTRVTTTGQVIDLAGVPYMPQTTPTLAVAAASDGTNTLAAWVDDRSIITSTATRSASPYNSVLFEALIAPDGSRIPLPVTTKPTAIAGLPLSIYLGRDAVLNGFGIDPYGYPLSYQWTVTDSPPGAAWTLSGADSATAVFRPSVSGNYTLSLVVTDAFTTSEPSLVSVEVKPWLPPVAVATAEPTTGTAPLTVCFDASRSYSAQSPWAPLYHVAVDWDFGDGSPLANQATVCHTYAASRIPYAATVTVRDTTSLGAGLFDRKTFSITVTGPVFSGFGSPVSAPPVLNRLRAGAAVPIKFSLNGFWGFDVVANGYPKVALIPCDDLALVEAIDDAAAAGSSGWSYDESVDQYKYVWKTDRGWAGNCVQLQIRLANGEVYWADFLLSR